MEKMQLCVNCGYPASAEAHFCPECGYDFTKFSPDISNVDDFLTIYYGVLYQEKKFLAAGHMMNYYYNHLASEEEKKKLDSKSYNNPIQLLVLDSVTDEREMEAFHFALSGQESFETALGCASQYALTMYWDKVFDLRKFAFLACDHILADADAVLNNLLEARNNCRHLPTYMEIDKTFNAYLDKVRPYNTTIASRYACYLNAIDLENIPAETEHYANRIASWILAVSEDFLNAAIRIHKADYLEQYRLDEETSEQIRQTLANEYREQSKAFAVKAQELLENVEKPIRNLISQYVELDDQPDSEDKTAALKQIEEDFKACEALLWDEATKQGEDWQGGCLPVLQEIMWEHRKDTNTDVSFLTDYVKTVFGDLEAHGEKLHNYEEYLE